MQENKKAFVSGNTNAFGCTKTTSYTMIILAQPPFLCKQNKEALQLENQETVEIINMQDVESKEVEWLWYPFIPYGKLTIIQGDPGEGKTSFILNLAAKLSQGECFEQEEKQEPLNIIYQTAEDGLNDTVKPRLERAGADCSKILVIDDQVESLSFQDERIEKAIRQTGAKLIVFDPLQAYLGERVDMNRANEIREVTKKIAQIADRYSCAIVLIGHMNKGGGIKAAYRGMGSIDFFAIARSVLLVARVPEEPDIRAIAQIKNNLAPEAETVAFRLEENSFEWIGGYEITTDELLSGFSSSNKKKKAEDLVMKLLTENESYPSKEIYEKGKQAGISRRTLESVKSELNIISFKEKNAWYWKLK